MELLTPQIIILTITFGVIAGFLAGLLGIGGGVVLVPLFLWLFPLAGLPPELVVHTAFGTSLAIILPTAVISTLGHRKRGNIHGEMVLYLALGGIIGGLLGATVAALVSGSILKICFGLLQIVISVRLLFFKQPYLPPESIDCARPRQFVAVGFIGGSFSAFFGIGGGVITVPLLLLLLHLPMRLAVGNSSALIVVSSLAAVTGYIWHGLQQPLVAPYSLGYVNWLVVLLVAPVTMICARLGVRFAGRTSQTRLIRIFAVVLLSIGVKIVFNL
ncbi:MAG: sulfite exporter TauE/SafE family protein [Desulfuromonadales bacterium]|nr:sulfite exporter TauE/SafE family protein [Desulfuromonadales bacterium]